MALTGRALNSNVRAQIVAYSVALVVDPQFGGRVVELSNRMHTWLVDSSSNCAAAEAIWAAKVPGTPYSVESGVTTFKPYGATPEDWCVDIVGSIDDHHNSYAHTPGYTVLEVYGVAHSERIRAAFQEVGFTQFTNTVGGFNATKPEP
jgi:hypothetical protein